MADYGRRHRNAALRSAFHGFHQPKPALADLQMPTLFSSPVRGSDQAFS
jgi:hypothetical protein